MKDLNEIIADQQQVIDSQIKQIAELTEKLDQFPAPALPEATVENLKEKFQASYNTIGSMSECFHSFLPAIQEYVYGAVKAGIKDACQTTADDRDEFYKEELASKDAEISELKRLLLEDETGVLKAAVQYATAEKDAEIKALNERLDYCKKQGIAQIDLTSKRSREIEDLKAQIQQNISSLKWIVPDGGFDGKMHRHIRHAETKAPMLLKEGIRGGLKLVDSDGQWHFYSYDKIEYLDESAFSGQQLEAKQTGLRWVKAIERMPQERGIYFVKIKHRNDRMGEEILSSTAIIEAGVWENRDSSDLWYDIIEWLDESGAVPDATISKTETVDARQEAIAFAKWFYTNVIQNTSEFCERHGYLISPGDGQFRTLLQVYEYWQLKQQEVDNGK